MTKYFQIHPENPQKRVIAQASEALAKGAVVAYPTDSSYALGCLLDNRHGVEIIRKIRDLKENHPLTMICASISQAAQYAHIDDVTFRYLKSLTPGCYTFILPATKKVPKTVVGAKRKVVGIRIPNNPTALSLVEEVGQPLLSSTLMLSGDDEPVSSLHDILPSIKESVGLVLDAGDLEPILTTIVEIVSGKANIIREGAGSIEPFAD